MPITRNEVLLSLKAPSTVQRDLIREADLCLAKPSYVKDWKCGSEGALYWKFAVPGTLSKQDKEEVIAKYLQVGWSKVEVSNSEDHGDPPGLCGLTLYA